MSNLNSITIVLALLLTINTGCDKDAVPDIPESKKKLEGEWNYPKVTFKNNSLFAGTKTITDEYADMTIEFFPNDSVFLKENAQVIEKGTYILYNSTNVYNENDKRWYLHITMNLTSTVDNSERGRTWMMIELSETEGLAEEANKGIYHFDIKKL